MATIDQSALEETLRDVDSNTKKLVGALITLRRIGCGLTQEKLAQNVGLSRPTLSMIESPKGSQGSRINSFVKIFNALGITSDEIQKIKQVAKDIDPDKGLDFLMPGNDPLKVVFAAAIKAVASQASKNEPHLFSRAACVTAILTDYPLGRLP